LEDKAVDDDSVWRLVRDLLPRAGYLRKSLSSGTDLIFAKRR
jgi:hypothetical protein